MARETIESASGALPIAVIGAGFSGTMTALHLLRESGRQVLLCERGGAFARGVAYGTGEAAHLLNVRAANMSAFPDQPAHFADWLEGLGAEADGHVRETAVGAFASRDLYGRYIGGLLREAIGEADRALRLRIIPDEAEDLIAEPEGGYTLVLAGGRRHRVAGTVLAIGNLAAPDDSNGAAVVVNPWKRDLAHGLNPNRPVAILGSALTMVDIVMQLRMAGFAGKIIALSRHGLLPFTHTASASWPMPDLSSEEKSSPALLLKRLRREARAAGEQGIAWQAVIDSIRPVTARLWAGWSTERQRAFLRHARAWWDIHRHRMAPPVAEAIAGFIADGNLEIRAGHVESTQSTLDGVTIRYRPRGKSDFADITAQRLIHAMGPARVDVSRDRLLGNLVRRGLIRPDAHGLGIETRADLTAIGANGDPAPGLWALGPLVRGVFWECTAVPDIRTQAAALARAIAQQTAA